MGAHGFSDGALLATSSESGYTFWQLWRLVDVVIAAVLLIVLLPLLLVVVVAIRIDSPGPALFRQRRVGIGMRTFTVNKFRTMRRDAHSGPHENYVARLIKGDRDAAAGDGSRQLFKLEDDDRITAVGRWLRRWSLDELPQLWNVLRGEMSLVGPRPAIPYELDHYEPAWYGRFSVQPGITGLWQVSGRSRLTFRDMVRLDIEYVRTRSLVLNLRILARTVGVVLRGRDAA